MNSMHETNRGLVVYLLLEFLKAHLVHITRLHNPNGFKLWVDRFLFRLFSLNNGSHLIPFQDIN